MSQADYTLQAIELDLWCYSSFGIVWRWRNNLTKMLAFHSYDLCRKSIDAKIMILDTTIVATVVYILKDLAHFADLYLLTASIFPIA